MAHLAEPIVKDDGFGSKLTLVESGQMRPYADSRWAGTVTITRDNLNHEEMAKSLIESQVGEGHIFPAGVDRPFHCPAFVVLEKGVADPTTWKFIVERSYLD